MKVALTCPASLPATQFGGILFLCVDIAKELSDAGHDMTIYTTDMDFANNPNTFNKNLPRVETYQKFKIKRSHVLFSLKLFFVNPGMYLQMMHDEYDVIHSIGVRSFQSFIAAVVAKKKKIPLVISDQGGLTTHPDLTIGIKNRIIYSIQKPMINFVIKQAEKISVANNYEKEIFSKFCNPSKIEVIKNGINLEIINSTSINFKEKYNISTPFILFLGRFSKVKGVDILLHAVNLIKNSEEMKNIKLVIMGVDFGFESEMIEIIKKLKLSEKIKIIKKPPREDVLAAYKESKFLVLPSRWELSPLTPLEGFAFKKPVVSTTAHGIPHTITNNEHGILVESENYHELALAISTLLKDDEKCKKFGLAGFNLVQNTCNSRHMARETLKIYQKIVGK